MRRRILLLLSIALIAGCHSLDSASLGGTQTVPLKSVDGEPLPVSLTDGRGGAAQIVSGSLTVYSTKTICDWTIALGSGKSIPGVADCAGSGVKTITGGIELSLDARSIDGPQGTHSYDFVATQGPCSCPKFCSCQAQRSVPGERGSATISGAALRLRLYSQTLQAPGEALVPVVQKQ